MNPLMRCYRGSAGGGGSGPSTGGGGGNIPFSSLGLLPGQDWTVPAGQTIVLDVDTPALGCVEVDGILTTDGLTRNFTAQCVEIHDGGAIEFGTAAVPLTTVLTITLNGAYVPLTGAGTNVTNNGMMRGLQVMPGGRLDLHGTPPSVLWTTLGDHALNNATSLTLAVSPGWAANDAIVLANTDFPSTYNNPSNTGQPGHVTQQFTLNGATSGVTANLLSAAVVSDHWGKLQYPVDTLVNGVGMALTQNTFSTKKAHAEVPTVLDERARVANLTRNIVIQAPNDPDWQNKGHGAHVMWMGDGTTNLPLVRIDGVQIRRGGQRGAIGRYPFHAHMLSYNESTGAATADATSSYVKRCVVWQSENRAYTVHGTCGMTWFDNIAYDIKGHAFFLEDGSEMRNDIRRNSVFKVREPATAGYNYSVVPIYLGNPMPAGFVSMSGNGTTVTVNWTNHGLYSGQTLSVNGSSTGGFDIFRTSVVATDANHFTYPNTGVGSATLTPSLCFYGNDQIKIHDYASSGYWITNLGNYFEDNYASDCVAGDKNNLEVVANGAWISLADQCFGHSFRVNVNPNTTDNLLLKGFTCHSNYNRGLFFGFPVSDELGTFTALGANKYFPTSGNLASTDHVFWKNNSGAYFNSVRTVTYQRWTTADNGQVDFQGSTNNGVISERHLLIGTSLNNAQPNSPSPTDYYPRAGFFPYHGTVAFRDLTAVNFPYSAFVYKTAVDKGSAGGVSDGGSDNYDVPGISLSESQNTNIRLINSHYGEMCPPIHLDGRNVDVPGSGRHYSIASVTHDLAGRYGTAGKFMLPFSRVASSGTLGGALTAVDDYFLTGAANLADGPTSGTVVCKTTDTRWFGWGWADSVGLVSDTLITGFTGYSDQTPITCTRQVPATGVTIGTPFLVKRGDVGSDAFIGYRTVCVMSGGRFQIDFNDATYTSPPPTTYFLMQLINANTSGDNVILGIPWSGSVVPRICFGSHFSNEPMTLYFKRGPAVGGQPTSMNTFASAADVTAVRAKIPTVSGTMAAVVADASGNTYFRDTANNRVWIRYTAGPYTANADPVFPTIYDQQYVVIKA